MNCPDLSRFKAESRSGDPTSVALGDKGHPVRRILRATVRLIIFIILCATNQLAEGSQPNIIVIITDDMRKDDVLVMPNLRTLIAGRGAAFQHYYDNVAVCSPSRACILGGQYSHNNLLDDNTAMDYSNFRSAGELSTISTLLDADGYRTCLIGKYLNAYHGGTTKLVVPPGWDEWYSAVAGNPYSEYNYTLNETRNGVTTLVSYGGAPSEYGTDVYAAKGVDFITRAVAAAQPFLLYVAPYAPHEPATPAPRHLSLFPGAAAPRPPNFDETDVSDKPACIRALPRLTASDIAAIDALHRLRLQSLQAVDEMIANLVNIVTAAGQLGNTWFIFTSDNGFHLGNHRMPHGKWTPYQEDTLLPLLICGPAVAPGTKIAAMVGNVDVAPTVLELVGLPIPSSMDGRSLVPLLQGSLPGVAPWRQAYLIEHTLMNGVSPSYPSGPYVGVHTGDFVYVEHLTGERELYDLRIDPFQLRNVSGGPLMASIESALAARVQGMRSAGGDAIRAAEAVPLGPLISTPPADCQVTEGQAAIFQIQVAGAAPLGFQWRRNALPIPGATSTTYQTSMTVIGDDGAVFDVIVGNGFGTMTSPPALLSVRPASTTTGTGTTAGGAGAGGGSGHPSGCGLGSSLGTIALLLVLARFRSQRTEGLIPRVPRSGRRPVGRHQCSKQDGL